MLRQLDYFGKVILLATCLGASWTYAQAQAPVPPTDIPPAVEPALAQTTETLSARTLVRLEQLTRELSQTIGRVEALEATIAAQKSETERLATMIDQLRANSAVTETSAKAASEAAHLAAVPIEPKPELFEAPLPPQLSPTLMLTNAQSALQSGGYSLAEANLAQLIWVYPTSPEASEARWLLGEARFVQSAWGMAAAAYVDYLKVTPQGPRASEALIRLAGAFRQLGDNRQRCVALSEFKRRTPRPDATLKARADGEIARMPCPAA